MSHSQKRSKDGNASKNSSRLPTSTIWHYYLIQVTEHLSSENAQQNINLKKHKSTKTRKQ
jgi:hypothetical protein